MTDIHVVIPNYNHYHLINELLFSLYKYERENIISILVVDDASTDEEVKTGLTWWKNNGMLPLHVITNKENIGFLRTANIGLRYYLSLSPNDVLILFGTGTKVTGKFISQAVQQLTQCQLVGGVLYEQDTGWNRFGKQVFPYLEGWLLATTVVGWQDLGYFDERYSPQIFEDVDLSTTAIEKGYKLVPLNSPSLFHTAGQSINYTEERHKQTRINQKKFMEKWVKTNE